MTYQEYLKSYGKDEYRLIKWLMAYNIPPRIVKEELRGFYEQNRKFRNGTDFAKVLKENCMKRLFAFRETLTDRDIQKIVSLQLMPLEQEIQSLKKQLENLKPKGFVRRLWHWIRKA